MTLEMKYQEYLKEGRAEGSVETLAHLVEDGMITLEKAAATAGMEVEKFSEAVERTRNG